MRIAKNIIHVFHSKISYCFIIAVLTISIPRTQAQDTIKLLKYAGNLKQVKVNIANEEHRLLFDSGGGFTLVSPEVARKLRKSPYGNMSGYRMTGEKISYQRIDSVALSFPGLTLLHPELGIWDVMSILPAGLPKIDGVLSLKSFEGRVLEMDLANDRLIIHTTTSWHTKDSKWQEIPARFATGNEGNELTIFLNTPRNGRNYWLLFDSGNIGQLLLSGNTLKEWQPTQADSTAKVQALKFDINPLAKQLSYEIRKILYDGALNFDIIRQYRFLLDLNTRKVWVNKP